MKHLNSAPAKTAKVGTAGAARVMRVSDSAWEIFSIPSVSWMPMDAHKFEHIDALEAKCDELRK